VTLTQSHSSSNPQYGIGRWLSVAILVLLPGCGGEDTGSKGASVPRVCESMCTALSAANCAGFEQRKCVSDCAKSIEYVPACTTYAVASSDCVGLLSPASFTCQGAVAAITSETACEAEDAAWQNCIAQNVAPDVDCTTVCQRLYQEACPNPEQLATCESNCSYASPALDACANQLNAYDACLMQQPFGSGDCTNGQPNLVRNCSVEGTTFADCVRSQ
jgi:hypothetical protein